MSARLSLLPLALVAGCHWALNDTGTDPKPEQFYFPNGVAMDPGGQYLYVSNGNADLRYGGGTVMLVDVLKYECVLATLRGTTPPAGCSAYGDANALADLARLSYCRTDPLEPSIVDCDESYFIAANSTVRVGNFAGAIKILPGDGQKRELFVTVRGDPSVTKIDVDLGRKRALDCFTPAHGAVIGDNVPALGALPTAPTCDVDHLAQQYNCSGSPTCGTGDTKGVTQLPTEPFGTALDVAGHKLLVSHLSTGQVSLFDTALPWSMSLLTESSPFFPADSTGHHGAFALAQQHPGDSLSPWYLTSNVNPLIATFRVYQAKVIVGQTTFGVLTSFAQGGDVRDIMFDVDGNRAFVTENNPPSLLVIDTSTSPQSGNQPRNVVTDIIDVCQAPSHMVVTRLDLPGAPGAPPYPKTKVLVVCFLSSQVMIVDPDRPGVDDTIFSGFGGPNGIALNDWPGSHHAYVTNYTESTLSIIDIEPGSQTENRVIARLGFPPDGYNP